MLRLVLLSVASGGREAQLDLGAEDLGPQHRLVEVQLAVELLDDRGLGLQVDDRVDALGLLVDLVRETATAPDVDLLDAAAALADDGEELVERAGRRCAPRDRGRG